MKIESKKMGSKLRKQKNTLLYNSVMKMDFYRNFSNSELNKN